ncbi:selenocysteine-specific translation elongation factor [Mobilicoccus caccae]|uniref:Selenocysteine-specific elongation factor n=1 Tax=Mobilicoccus caccae TaxID=1859295 RepID=A0ABQ6IUG1_9MICO|nr:selenocysteine-specific translation elongation factor [Mobilicoccus caccae]GMA40933.1 selenocysteine-specific translation elongation factor [Mobilicoccus caccae]
MHVVATAGHVDHGKSSLVRALTGMEPDRWEEERRRELTIDLGFAWTTLDSGDRVAFVDVPGHRRFIGNMLAGLGPAPAVVFVVAADESWMPQSAEHLAAAAALGVRHVVVVVTRADLADPAPALERAVTELRAVGIEPREALAASSRTGEGIAAVKEAVLGLVGSLPVPDPDARVRLWVDRAFTIRGAGTVVTGTLGSGRIRVGDTLDLAGRRVTVRGLHALEEPHEEVLAPARVAVNLRGITTDDIHRGHALLTPDSWPTTSVLDVRLTLPEGVAGAAELPEHLMLHIGTAGVQARVRPLGTDVARLTLPVSLPLAQGDRALLRDPGTGTVTGLMVLDVAPPALTRRGAGARRAADLTTRSEAASLATEVRDRGHLTPEQARRLGVSQDEITAPPAGIALRAGVFVDDTTWREWGEALRSTTAAYAREHPLEPWMPAEAARRAVGLPTLDLLAPLAAEAGLTHARGRVHEPGLTAHLGAAEAGLASIEARLRQTPFAAPEKPDLDAAGLGPRQIAAAVDAGRLIRLPDDVLLLPLAPAQAMRVLAGLPQPFTTSQARQALDTTRRVVIPLLEHLDSRGWTRRIDAGHREIAR